MRVEVTIGFSKIVITEPMIDDVYYIEKSRDTNKFYIWSENGCNMRGIQEYNNLENAIKEVKKLIKNHFVNRCLESPKGFN